MQRLLEGCLLLEVADLLEEDLVLRPLLVKELLKQLMLGLMCVCVLLQLRKCVLLQLRKWLLQLRK